MVVKNVENFLVLRFVHILKKVYLQQLNGMLCERGTQYHWSMKGIRKGHLFSQECYIKGYRC